MIDEERLRKFIAAEYDLPLHGEVMNELVKNDDIRRRFETLTVVSETRLQAELNRRANLTPNRHARRKVQKCKKQLNK